MTQTDKTNESGKQVQAVTQYITNSYVLDSLNKAMKDLEPLDASSNKDKGYFELQKRLPNGATIPVQPDELESRDMEHKIEQTAKLLEQMTETERLKWAHVQRQHGNQLYKEGQYKEAIDIYLTCLTVRDVKPKIPSTDGGDHDPPDTVADTELFLPVMNNLAQCTLQLGWYHKTETFCSLALKEMNKHESSSSREHESPISNSSTQDSTIEERLLPSHLFLEDQKLGVAKLYFKRGKARRLRGMYGPAKQDLLQAQTILGVENNTTPEHRAIERELHFLAKAVREGQRNKRKAQRAMQTVLGSTTTPPSLQETTPHSVSQQASNDPQSDALYADKPQRKKFSTLRKRKPEEEKRDDKSVPSDFYHEKLTYWEVYRIIIARVAQKLLDWIGDEDEMTTQDTSHVKRD